MSIFPKDPRLLLPHRPPLLLLDSVDSVDQDGARGTLTLRPDNPFVDADGLLERVAFAEIMAQCFAAYGASQQQAEAKPAVGYLAALRDVQVLGDARLGDVLTASAKATACLGGITVVEAQVWREGQLLASGQCKIFVAPDDSEAKA